MRPFLSDLFCGEGGAGIGYAHAGFMCDGVDTRRAALKRYVLHNENMRGYANLPPQRAVKDALEVLGSILNSVVTLTELIHASPPCQAYSIATSTPGARASHPDLLGEVIHLLTRIHEKHGIPSVVENVPGAHRLMPGAITLCGKDFGLTAVDDDGTMLRLQRHRLFLPIGWELPPPPNACTPFSCKGDKTIPVGGVYGGGRSDRREAKQIRRGGYTPAQHIREQLMGVEPGAFTQHGLAQAIPPAYTQYVGEQFMQWQWQWKATQ